MYCPSCGKEIRAGSKFCSNCGNPIGTTNLNAPVNNVPSNNNEKNENIKLILTGSIVGVIILTVITVTLLLIKGPRTYNFDGYDYAEGNKREETSGDSNKKYQTSIVYDNVYRGITVNGKDEALELIREDSIKQKDNCSKKIKAVEERIIEKYNITAVNFCELSLSFALELEKVVDLIYTKYPSVRENLTNIILVNDDVSSYIAAFQPYFPFAGKDDYTYPWVIKTQILLNARYFLNEDLFNSAVKSSSASGHFPKNATKASAVAHEFGHYLSYLAMIKTHDTTSFLLMDYSTERGIVDSMNDFNKGTFSLKMLNEAFENYKKDHVTSLTFDEWRGSISAYALAKDNNGNYIYDETIAEAFHDVYLNGKKASLASTYIVSVLEKYLES